MRIFKILYRDTENYIECENYVLSKSGQSLFYIKEELIHCIPKSAVVIDVTPETEIVKFLDVILDTISSYRENIHPNLENDIPIEDKSLLRIESRKTYDFWQKINELKKEFKESFNLNN